MRYFRSLVSLLSRLRPASDSAVDLAIAGAYQRVFTGNPSEEDQNLVLIDLANVSGFYRVTSPAVGASRDDILFNEGQRAVYARIFRFLRMSDAEMISLETAARLTAAGLASDNEGE
jgi:hypothetical protein